MASETNARSAENPPGRPSAPSASVYPSAAVDMERSTSGAGDLAHVDWVISPDLTTEQGVRTYLAGTPFASSQRIETVSGGSANYVYRIWLDTPLEGKKTLILKHTKPYVREYQHIAFTDKRQVFEVEALRRVTSWLPKESVAQVPHVHQFDEEAHTIIMDDAGESSVTLKEFMKQGGPSLEMAADIGKAVGEFLGRVHAQGTTNRAEYNIFEGHAEGKVLGAAYYYGRLASFFSGKSGEPKLEDPPLRVDDATLEILKRVGEETTQAMLSAKDHWVQGDFWPGNMLVVLDSSGKLEKILVVDWEMSRIGLPGIEVGQFAAEIYFCGRFHKDVCEETSRVVLDNYFAAYSSQFPATEDLARRALIHFGTHLAIIGPTVGWGPKEISREVALEGTRVIVEGYQADLAGLKKSQVGGLLDGR